MKEKLIPAHPAFDVHGTPFSPIYRDVYHSAASGPEQARHVFLAGNGLPARWAHAPTFTIVETGFGLGLNFLATWQAWRADARHCDRLHFVSVEKHPFERAALSELHVRYPEFAPLAAALRAAWPSLLPGLHRRHFEDGRVTLTLAFGDVAAVLPQLCLSADAFYLDGFAPQRNCEMWSPRVMQALARLANPDATLATYTTARAVREALAAAGFAVEKRTGFGGKREMLAGRHAPRWTRKNAPPSAPRWPERHAIIIGAGLAGVATAERLAARGWRIELVERRAHPAAETSSMPAGIVQPHLSPDDCLLSRFTRAGFLYALEYWQTLQAAGHEFTWQRGGVLQIAADNAETARMRKILRAHGYPSDYAQYLSRAAASKRAGCRVTNGGWWFPAGGWLRPAGLIAAQLAATKNLTAQFNIEVHELARDGANWRVLARGGRVIATAPVVVLANAHDAARLAAIAAPLQRIRGQLTSFAAAAPLTTAVCGSGYVVPLADGTWLAGASYAADDDAEPSATDDRYNSEHVAQLLPDIKIAPAETRSSSVGWRCVAPDHMPLIGALPDIATAHIQSATLSGAQLADLPRLPGLYGAFGYASRGLTWAALGGELLAAMIEGEPLPIERALENAVDPGRFALKQLRRGKLAVYNGL